MQSYGNLSNKITFRFDKHFHTRIKSQFTRVFAYNSLVHQRMALFFCNYNKSFKIFNLNKYIEQDFSVWKKTHCFKEITNYRHLKSCFKNIRMFWNKIESPARCAWIVYSMYLCFSISQKRFGIETEHN